MLLTALTSASSAEETVISELKDEPPLAEDLALTTYVPSVDVPASIQETTILSPSTVTSTSIVFAVPLN